MEDSSIKRMRRPSAELEHGGICMLLKALATQMICLERLLCVLLVCCRMRATSTEAALVAATEAAPATICLIDLQRKGKMEMHDSTRPHMTFFGT